MRILVERGTYRFTHSPQEVLYTPKLGAGVAIGILDAESGLAGLGHYVLPEARGLEVPEGFPAFFVNPGLGLFFQEFRACGGDLQRAKIVVAGGGRFKNTPPWLDLGGQNLRAVRYFLQFFSLRPLAERVGEPGPRSLEVSLKEGLKVYTFEKVEIW